ncbi:MAG: hypothetical protein HFJ09_11930 [Lachnospiraceae bacterium]|nr:hypothetical protein [Lachnospiraceae bacterium]
MRKNIKKLVGGAITCIALTFLGLNISSEIEENQKMKKEQYENAAQIETSEEFTQAIKNNIGYAFIYGELAAVDPVVYPELEGEYLEIKKEKERYVEHVINKDVDDNITGCHTETTHRWEIENVERKKCENVILLDVTLQANKIKLPQKSYITAIKESRDLRYCYYGTESRLKGTLYAKLANNSLEEAQFFESKDIGQTVEYLENGAGVVIFWILWMFLIMACVYVVASLL